MSDYAEIADLSWDNIQEPKPLPSGTYLLKLKNVVFQPAKEEGRSPVVMFVHSAKEPMSDVSSEELAALGDGYDISENKLFTRVYIEDGSSWKRVKDILSAHDVEVTGSIPETFKKAVGAEALGGVTKAVVQRKDKSYVEINNVGDFGKVSDGG